MKFYKIGLFLVCCIGLFGCGQQKQEVIEEKQVAINWKEEGFADAKSFEENTELWIDEYVLWNHEALPYDHDTEDIFYIVDDVCYQNDIYRLYAIMEPPYGVATKWILEKYQNETTETVYQEISYEQLGVEYTAYITDMDVIGNDHFIFQVVGFGKDDDGNTAYQNMEFIDFDPNGQIEKTDFLSVYQEKGLLPEETNGSISISGECIADKYGNIYTKKAIENQPYKQLYVIDKNGEVQMEYFCTESEEIENPFRMEDDSLIFPIYDRQERTTRFVWFDPEQKKQKELGKVEDDFIHHVYGIYHNDLYYEGMDGIIRFNIASGECTQIFSFSENGVNKQCRTMLLFRQNEPPVLRIYNSVNAEANDWFGVLSYEKVERTDAVHVISLLSGSEKISLAVTECNKANPNFRFDYELGNQADYRTRMFADLSADKGPDIMYVSQEDMEKLAESGALIDLKTLISDDLLQDILPGALELGTINDTLVGIPLEVTAYTIKISSEVWKEKSWSLEDIISLMESGQVDNRVSQGNIVFYPTGALNLLVGEDLEASFLIDFENKKSNFEDERFIRLLECLKEGENKKTELTDLESEGGGKVMSFSGLLSLSDISDFYGEKIPTGSKYVGVPTNRDNGKFLDSNGFLVVSKNITQPEAVSAYFEYALGEEIQFSKTSFSPDVPVRKLSTDQITYDENNRAFAYGMDLLVFDDGTTSLHEAIRFLDSFTKQPKRYPEITKIMYEESQAFFNGDKSAKETAQIIDSRVQIYLDENDF